MQAPVRHAAWSEQEVADGANRRWISDQQPSRDKTDLNHCAAGFVHRVIPTINAIKPERLSIKLKDLLRKC